MNGTLYRPLTDSEITLLESNGCSAADWKRVEVAEAFFPERIRHCRFSGTVRLGNHVSIDGVPGGIENYEIGDHVIIQNTECLICHPGSRFGNGTRVSVLIESGGREVPLFDRLTAPLAWLIAMNRHRTDAVRRIEELIRSETEMTLPGRSRIGAGSRIVHCGMLTDLCIGEYARIEGAAELSNGTINSRAEAPTTIGRGVIARHFIVGDSVEITDYALLENCFIGQGCRIGKGFSAENSLFFANCECYRGEACSVLAGPYTVTHHKSTLLVGGMFSFYNAGSNSNQSNHMYRLGPMHQGILERGCKTGSGSYLLFPARIGAFSIVKGRHYHHPDTALLPFSYLIEENGRTVLLPGATLRSIGLSRDLRKWPERDRRRGEKWDPIIFDASTPYVVEQLLAGLDILQNLEPGTDAAYRGTVIPARQIERGITYYRTAIDFYLGTLAAELLDEGIPPAPQPGITTGWLDAAGLPAPQSQLEHIIQALPQMHSLRELEAALTQLYVQYDQNNRTYAARLMSSRAGKTIDEFMPADWTELLKNGEMAAEALWNWQQQDAAKEAEQRMQIGYRPTADTEQAEREFEAIHGLSMAAALKKLKKDHDLLVETFRRHLECLA